MDDSLFIPKPPVKRIMKLNEEVAAISADGVAATSKITELFLEKLILDSQKTSASHNRKTIKVDDIIETAAKKKREYQFLEGAFGSFTNQELK